MKLGRLLWAVVVCGAICGPAGAQVAPPRGVSPAAPGGGAAAPGAVSDQWLSEVALEALGAAADGGKYRELGETIRGAALGRLACGSLEGFAALNDLQYVMRACRFLPMAEKTPGGKDFAAWLIQHRDLSRILFRALEDVKKPPKALEAMQALLAAGEEAVLAYKDLSVAFATSQPLKHYRQQHQPCTMLEGFQWYTNPRNRFRYNLKGMPYELSRYLADTRLNLAERAWAMQQYGRHPRPAASYFDLEYDYDHFEKHEPKKIAKLDYTLPNLRKVGGVCIDQAYYSTEVCKALGIPASVVSGRGRSGIGHAWTACLVVIAGGRQAAWDARTGRYSASKYYTGDLHDPATGKEILDCELALAGMAAQLDLQRREEADSAVAMARLVDEVARGDASAEADLGPLKELSQRYETKHVEDKALLAAKPMRTGWIKPARKIDRVLVEDLIDLSIRRNLAHRSAWEFIIELRKDDRLPVDHLDRFFDVLVTRTARQYPDYSCEMVLRIVPTIGDGARREKVYQRSLAVYGRRPDLQGRILLALGDDYRDREKPADALRIWEQAALRAIEVPDVVVTAASSAEGLLVGQGRRDMAIRMYLNLFRRCPAETDAAQEFRTQTAYYQLGKRLAELLKEDGKIKEAEAVINQITKKEAKMM